MKDQNNTADNSPHQESSCCANASCGASQSTIRRTAPKVGRNDPCPCGNGRKFKKCCGKSL